ncbi:major facilitator superfamily-like protein [Aureococcus anophagefferens]|nr:major facilitator superfamily-like protein [Aureococcus anophagefferens]
MLASSDSTAPSASPRGSIQPSPKPSLPSPSASGRLSGEAKRANFTMGSIQPASLGHPRRRRASARSASHRPPPTASTLDARTRASTDAVAPKDKVALEVIDAEPPDPAMDAEVVLATHAAAAATLKAASCGADLAVAELAPGDRICWAAVVTGAHVPLRYLMDEPPFPSLDVLDAQKALARSRRASTLQSVTVKAVPGSSTRKAAVAGDVGTWEPSVASRFVLRGPDYLRDKKKFPSAEELYEPFALDVLRRAAPLFDLPARAQLPPKRPHEEDLPAWCPRILVQNMFFPGEPPALFGGPPKPEEREREGAPGLAGRLLVARHGGGGADHQGAARGTGRRTSASGSTTRTTRRPCPCSTAPSRASRVDNIGDASLGLPRLLHQFNAKPVLMAAAALRSVADAPRFAVSAQREMSRGSSSAYGAASTSGSARHAARRPGPAASRTAPSTFFRDVKRQ